MKQSLYTLMLIITGALTGMAQCTPDAAAINLPQTSIYPDSLDVSNSTSLTIVIGSLVGSSETGGLAVYVNWAILDSISGLPNQITYAQGGSIYNGSSWIPTYSTPSDPQSLLDGLGCINFYVEPNYYSSDIDITIHGTANYTFGSSDITFPVSQNAVLQFGEIPAGISCSDLFISEYIEGASGNNKALELYNPTTSTIDLSQYAIERYSNGSTAATDALTLSGNLSPYEVVVITNGQTDSVWVASGTGGYWSEPIDSDLYNLGDLHCSGVYPTPFYFNGNDAIALVKNGGIVDIFGKIGENPGLSWTDDPLAMPPYTSYNMATGSSWWTRDITLNRKEEIGTGTAYNPLVFNATVEWDTLPNGTYSGLGWHDCLCQCDVVEISGESVIQPVTNTYTYAISQPGTEYSISWVEENGLITSGQGTNSVDVIWDGTGFGELVVSITNGVCTSYDTLSVSDITVGIVQEKIEETKVSPNPSTGIFTVNVPDQSNIQVSVYDALGKLVTASNEIGFFNLDLSDVPVGVYILRLDTESGTLTKKLVRE
ncbi:lamin tail domain-containing protein [Flavobacteriales bacterium]|nr:lamin tail domain-containing protein [Flavobacteriales bacterium]